MSAAALLSFVHAADSSQLIQPENESQNRLARKQRKRAKVEAPQDDPPICLAFYRKHTERMLKRYMHAAMLVGRSPSILADPVGRGWVSSRPVRSFEDAVIFVLDVEKCLDRLNSLDRALLSRIILQDYTQYEAASLLGMGVRTVTHKFPVALDRLTQLLMKSGVLVIPE